MAPDDHKEQPQRQPMARPSTGRESKRKHVKRRQQHWKYASFDEVRKLIAQTRGVPKDAVTALTVAFFLCARRPKEFSELASECKSATLKLLQWICEEGGPPNLVNSLFSIEQALIAPFLAFCDNPQHGVRLLPNTSIPLKMSIDSSLRPQVLRSKTDHSIWQRPNLLYTSPSVDSFMRLATRIFVELGFRTGLPSERRADLYTIPKEDGRKKPLAIWTVCRLVTKLFPSAKRTLNSSARQSRRRKDEPGEKLQEIRGLLESYSAQLRDSGTWIPEHRKHSATSRQRQPTPRKFQESAPDDLPPLTCPVHPSSIGLVGKDEDHPTANDLPVHPQDPCRIDRVDSGGHTPNRADQTG
jgi:hypothetical protein